MSIETNIQTVRQKMREAATCSEHDVVLIAVTKTVDIERMREVYRAGILDFGENRVQEIIGKFDEFPQDVRWHLIGTLQTNKVKYIIDKVAMIHSLDRISLAKEIDRRAGEHRLVMDCLVQVNISQEDTKHGQDEEEVLSFIREVSGSFPNIRIKGLMGMAPFVEEEEEIRRCFRRLKALFEKIRLLDLENVRMEHLSMGMTNDYEIAIQEGSTMVRVGTGIFGKRI